MPQVLYYMARTECVGCQVKARRSSEGECSPLRRRSPFGRDDRQDGGEGLEGYRTEGTSGGQSGSSGRCRDKLDYPWSEADGERTSSV